MCVCVCVCVCAANPILSLRNPTEGSVWQCLCNPSPFVLRISNNATNKFRGQTIVLEQAVIMVTTTLRSVRFLSYNGACVQTKRTVAHSAVATDMFWLLEAGSCECHAVMSTQTGSRCVRPQSAWMWGVMRRNSVQFFRGPRKRPKNKQLDFGRFVVMQPAGLLTFWRSADQTVRRRVWHCELYRQHCPYWEKCFGGLTTDREIQKCYGGGSARVSEKPSASIFTANSSTTWLISV